MSCCGDSFDATPKIVRARRDIDEPGIGFGGEIHTFTKNETRCIAAEFAYLFPLLFEVVEDCPE